MVKKIIIVMVMFLFAFCTAGYAQSPSLGVKVSTLGIGVEVEQSFLDSFGGRIGVNYFSFSYDGTEEDIEYEFDLNLMSVSALLDWHPFQGSFKISGGVLFNNNDIDANAKRADTFKIGDTRYTAAQVGTLKGKVDFDDVSPYLGLGWDTSFGKDNSFGLTFELGAVFQGAPQVDLSADGPIAGNAVFQSELAKEEEKLQSDLDNFEIYPVIAFGFIYRF